MHMLQIIFTLFYGGIIQPTATYLGISRIGKDPTTRYQNSYSTVMMMKEEMES